jgi:hypothetical protein
MGLGSVVLAMHHMAEDIPDQGAPAGRVNSCQAHHEQFGLSSNCSCMEECEPVLPA